MSLVVDKVTRIFDPSRSVQALQLWADSLVTFLDSQSNPYLVRAWGHISTDGNGGVALLSGRGISAVAISGANAQVTLERAMRDTNYAPLVTLRDTSAGYSAAVDSASVTTTTFEVRVYDILGDSNHSLATNAMLLGAMVCGELA